MKALGASHLNLFVSRQRGKERVGFGLSRHDCRFLVRRKHIGGGLLLLRVGANSISSPPSSQKNLGSEEIQRVNLDRPKTVRVKFKLCKQCEFGEQFLLVGDDPNLGLWDPCNGVPLIWSEGHVWAAEVDLPSSKVVNYKFILEEIDGTVSWQPGPDRVLETWDSAKVISVSEDWGSPDFQDVVEEEFVNDSSLLVAESVDRCLVEGGDGAVEEEVADSSLGLLIHENWNEVAVEEENSTSDDLDDPLMLMVAGNISDADESSESDEAMSSLENETRLVVDEVAPVLVSGLAAVPSEEVEEEEKETEESRIDRSVSSEVKESSASDETMSSLKNETRIVMDDVAPVLVSGLAALPLKEVEEEDAETETEASRIDPTQKKNSTVEDNAAAFDEIKDSSDQDRGNDELFEDAATEFEEKEDSTDLHTRSNDILEDTTAEPEAATEPEIRVSAALHCPETSETTAVPEEKTRLDGKKRILDIDMQWGRRTLHKFLANLGFMQHS